MNGKAIVSTLSIVAGLAASAPAFAQIAGSTTLGISVTESEALLKGWSAKKQILGKAVYNEKNEKIGTIDDIIIAPDKAVSYAIVGAGGFVGLGKHDVAIPVTQFTVENKKVTLPGASKEAVKALPPFKYAHK